MTYSVISGSRTLKLAVALFACLFLCGTVPAEELSYVTTRAGAIQLKQSATEVGVVLHDVAFAGKRSSKLTEHMTDVTGDPAGRVKILRLDPDAGVTRSLVASDPTIREVHPVYRFATSPHPVIGTGTLIAKVRSGLDPAAINELFEEYDVALVEALAGQPDVYLLAPKGDPDSCVACAARMAQDPRTVWAQPNLRFPTEQRQIAVGDSFFSQAWHLNNTGQLGGVPDADIDALEAWSIADGQDILFGMFDDSADFSHEDLFGGYIGIGHDPSVPSNNESAFRDPSPKAFGDNHGTRVLGLAVARANSAGARGVSFQSRWTASRGLNEFLTNAEQASVFTFAIQQDVDVHINSWGYFPGIPTPAVVEDAIRRAYDVGRNKGNLDTEEGDDPLGMVIVFASGNFGIENREGLEISTLPEVLAIGASTDEDMRASYSQFGASLDLLAPSGGDAGTAGIFTTDNRDRVGTPDVGANDGGINVEIGIPEVDPTGNYTGFFSGTSAACPVAAGVAGLVLSVNPLLSVPQVRMILTHTADRIDPDNANYHGITSHSPTHAYGRVNANRAVQAADVTLVNGGFTWPVSAGFVRVVGDEVRFRQNDETAEFLVVTGTSPFDFVPEDGTCYSEQQRGCEDRTLGDLPNGVTVHVVGCGLRCGANPSQQCAAGDLQCFEFTDDRTRYFGIYGYNEIGRYSFGVSVDSNGNVAGAEDFIRGINVSDGGGGGEDGGGSLPSQSPAVTIMASPLEGTSPLTVNFTGNAVSAIAIDNSRTQWDFDTSDGVLVDSTQRNTTHTYTVAAGETRNFVARLTMFDVIGNVGFSQVTIRVQGPSDGSGSDPTGSEGLRIIASNPSSPGSEISEGTSPFNVLLTVDASVILGTVQSVVWDLGDGTRLTGLTVPHTYINESTSSIRLPITATVTTRSSSGATATSAATKLITVFPGSATTDSGQPNLPGTGVPGSGGAATPCGVIGMIPLLGLVFSLSLMRRRTR